MSDLLHLWGIYLGTLVGLLPIINPLSAGPTFLAITEGDSQERRREQALKGSLYMVAILVSFLIGGTFIMRFFGISIPGLRITGGILLTGIGLDMLRARRTAPEGDKVEREAALRKMDISFTPLARPMLSGQRAWTPRAPCPPSRLTSMWWRLGRPWQGWRRPKRSRSGIASGLHRPACWRRAMESSPRALPPWAP